MKPSRLLLAALIAASSLAAQATVIGNRGGDRNAADFIPLSTSDVSGGLLTDHDVAGLAVTPVGAVGTFLAGEAGDPATISFGAGAHIVSFLWGSPDSYNTLVVNEANGESQSFTAAQLRLTRDGYVHFVATDTLITSMSFESSSPAFEAANFVARPVPEPASAALLLAGVGLLAFLSRRRG
ncbi:MAG TPA: PEP-CTERM sorting domain-containing protein [Burkholderiaceae bacterium]